MERDIKSDKKQQTIVSQFLKENLHECHERVSPWPQNATYRKFMKINSVYVNFQAPDFALSHF
jgi:hypothetical protein